MLTSQSKYWRARMTTYLFESCFLYCAMKFQANELFYTTLFLKAVVYSAFEYWSRDFTLSKGNGWIFSFSNTSVQFESIATPKVNYSSSADKELELSPNWRIITRWTLRMFINIILLKSDSGNEEMPFHHQINQFRFRGKIALGGNRLVKVYS